MKIASRPRAALSLLVLASSLGACHRPAPPASAAAVPAAGEVDPALAKLDDYTVCYAQLIGHGGLGETAREYASADLPHQPATARLSLNTGWLDAALRVLQRARALPGAPTEPDRRADALLGALAPLVDRLNALDNYYLARAYREDQLARGRREDGPLRAEFARAQVALRDFARALDAERDQQNARGMIDARARGDALTLRTRQALQQAGHLVALFANDPDLRNRAAFAQADQRVPALEASLDEQRRLLAAEKKPSPPDAPGDELAGYDMAARDLTQVVGAYRELRSDPTPAVRDDMARAYIGAVLDARNVARFNAR